MASLCTRIDYKLLTKTLKSPAYHTALVPELPILTFVLQLLLFLCVFSKHAEFISSQGTCVLSPWNVLSPDFCLASGFSSFRSQFKGSLSESFPKLSSCSLTTLYRTLERNGLHNTHYQFSCLIISFLIISFLPLYCNFIKGNQSSLLQNSYHL